MVLEKKLMGGTHGSAIPYIVMNDIAKFEVPFDKDVFDNISPAIKVVVDIRMFMGRMWKIEILLRHFMSRC